MKGLNKEAVDSAVRTGLETIRGEQINLVRDPLTTTLRAALSFSGRDQVPVVTPVSAQQSATRSDASVSTLEKASNPSQAFRSLSSPEKSVALDELVRKSRQLTNLLVQIDNQ